MTAATTARVADHFARTAAVSQAFFDAEAPRVAACCRHMADRFARGGVLLVRGSGARASDAHHVAVEFMHPVIVGKRALPAIALTDASAETVLAMAGPHDMLMLFAAGDLSADDRTLLAEVRRLGLMTIVMGSGPAGQAPAADFEFSPSGDPLVAQEVGETLYHVLWELVHVYFEADDAREVALLGAPAPGAVAAGVEQSTRQKAAEIAALRSAVEQRDGERIAVAGRDIAVRVRRGGRVLAFGNGGSATDAEDAAEDCLHPARIHWRRLPALALTSDASVLTAVGNDVGFDHIFARQLMAVGRPDDVALAFTTSGASRNLVRAMEEARSRGLLTLAFSGGDGGALARSPAVDVCVTVPSEHLPRIQEAHATAWHALLAVVQEALA